MSARAVLEGWLKAIAAGDLDGGLALLAEDVVVKIPLAPPGVPNSVAGRAAFAPLLRGVHANFDRYEWFDLELFGTDDPAVAIATAGSRVTLADGREYINDYVIYARVRGELIVEYREYFDPIRAGAALAPA